MYLIRAIMCALTMSCHGMATVCAAELYSASKCTRYFEIEYGMDYACVTGKADPAMSTNAPARVQHLGGL